MKITKQLNPFQNIEGYLNDEGNYRHHSVRLEGVNIKTSILQIYVTAKSITIDNYGEKIFDSDFDTDKSFKFGEIFNLKIFSRSSSRLPGGSINIDGNRFEFSIKEMKNSLKFRIQHLSNRENVTGLLRFAAITHYRQISEDEIMIGNEKYKTTWDSSSYCHRIAEI